MVSIFNDIVYKTAKKYGAEVLELRDIFVSSEDYANPIEPSHIGGGKLAKAIKEWIRRNIYKRLVLLLAWTVLWGGFAVDQLLLSMSLCNRETFMVTK